MNLAIQQVTVVRDDEVLRLQLGQGGPTNRAATAFPVTVHHAWKGLLGVVTVEVTTIAEVVLGYTEDEAQIRKQPERVRSVLASMMLVRAALRDWPDVRLTEINSDNLHESLLSLVAEPESLSRTTAELGRLLLTVRDEEGQINAVGAALSLGVGLHAIRRAARVLYRDGYVEGSGGVFGDNKLESFDPTATIALSEARLGEFARWLQTRRDLANLPVRFDFSRLHPEIAKAAEPGFKVGRWADAQFAALKQATIMARKKAGIENEKDEGEATMRALFAQDRTKNKGPWLRVDSSADWEATQGGLQRLFEGAQKLTNPVRHHEPHLGVDADSAFEYVVLASLLARVVERAAVAGTGTDKA